MAISESLSGSSDYYTETSDDQQQQSPIQPLILTNSAFAAEQSNNKKNWADVDTTDFLNSMIKFQAETNTSPSAEAFLDYVKKELNVVDDVTKRQVKDKIRRLKEKYDANKGKDLDLMKPNVKEVFELLDKVWGGGDSKMVVAVENGDTSRKRKADENGWDEIDENVEKVVEESDTENETDMETVNGNETENGYETETESENESENGNETENAVNENGNTSATVDETESDTEMETETEETENGNETETEIENAVNEIGNKANRVGSFRLSEERLLRMGEELFGGDEEIEGSEKWRKLEREEMELCLKQMDVKSAKMKLVLAAMDTMED